VTRLHFDGLGAHAFGHGAFEIGIDHPTFMEAWPLGHERNGQTWNDRAKTIRVLCDAMSLA
jgi:hypothetical protein